MALNTFAKRASSRGRAPVKPRSSATPYESPPSSPRLKSRPLHPTWVPRAAYLPPGRLNRLDRSAIDRSIDASLAPTPGLPLNIKPTQPYSPTASTPRINLLLSDRDAHLLDFPNSAPLTGGGSCEVYIAFYRPHNLMLAMKRPRLDFPTDDMLRRFRREASIWSTFTHDNILPFLGTMQINHRIYIVSPWMPLGDLLAFVQKRDKLIKEGKIRNGSVDEVVLPVYAKFNERKTIQEIAAGLEYLHLVDVIHGDMKAKNILLTDDGRAQICDFGLAKTLNHAVTSTELKGAGSARWQSPELLCNRPKSQQSDVYAFGMTIAEVLTADYPFPHIKEPAAVLFAIMNYKRPAFHPPSRLGIDFKELWELAARCWTAETGDRPSMTDVLRQLDSPRAASPLAALINDAITNQLLRSPSLLHHNFQRGPPTPSGAAMGSSFPGEVCICGRSYPTKTELDEHWADCGRNSKRARYPCSFCDNVFVRKDALRKHELSHRVKSQQRHLQPAEVYSSVTG